MSRVANPILPGFHPDPCLLRVGEWYYLATSTFEWWPGVRIHRSRDLATWELAGYALTRRSQLDLRGVPDSGGVWAPALSHAHGRFWLVYTNTRSLNGPFKDLRNYLVTAPAVEGPWSEPVELNASGFDPSFFHDDDGRTWLVNQLWRPSTGVDAFAGIVLQEYSRTEHRLVGEPKNIFRGSSLGITEGPHLYRKDGFYYLVTAEGGTGWNHAVTVARSRAIDGPYELSPHHPLLTSSDDPANPLQKAGHASFVSTPAGEWFLAHLCSRPVGPQRRCLLGRETALQRLEWPVGDWPRLAGGGHTPRAFVEIAAPAAPAYVPSFADDFTASALDLQWNTLREPATDSWLSLTERPGWLRLRGRYSLLSAFDQSLVGFRLLHHRCDVSTCLEFAPRSFQQSAGLALFYNSANFYYAFVTANDDGVRELRLLACDNRRCRTDLAPSLALPATGAVELSAQLDGETLQFFCAAAAGGPRPFGPALDATTLSDDYANDGGAGWAFTGPFAVLCAQDSGDTRRPADFDWFRYRVL
jgi:xylan 1,4-beta-xylosidase